MPKAKKVAGPTTGGEVETMAEGVAVLNEFNHRGTNTWGAYRNAYGDELAVNRREYTSLEPFEVVAIARRYKRGKEPGFA